MKQKMSVTRALVELKRMNDRINQAITSGKFVAVTTGRGDKKKLPNVSMTLTEARQVIQGSFDKVESLIRNREVLKSAVVLSNAKTMVTVMGKTMSVAEAIELKSTVDFRNAYLNTMRNQLHHAKTSVDNENAKLNQAIDALINTAYGSEKTKIDQGTYDAIANPQKDQKEAEIFDPLNIEKKIEKLMEEISNLGSELDFTLSESNAKTEIEVDLSV